ncbi:MAG: YidC/Oxa1 family insertase periplasmic-domain containing protein [Lentisphaeria bacterium]
MQKVGWMPAEEKSPKREEVQNNKVNGELRNQPEDQQRNNKNQFAGSEDTQYTPTVSDEGGKGEKTESTALTAEKAVSTTTVAGGGSRRQLRAKPAETLKLLVKNYMQASVAAESGGVTEVILERYNTYQGDAKVSLGNYRFPYCTVVSRTGKLEFGSGEARVYNTQHISLTRKALNAPLTLVEHWQLDSAGSYRLKYTIRLENSGDEAIALNDLSVKFGALTAEDLASSSKLSRVGRVDLAAELKAPDEKQPESFTAEDVTEMEASEATNLADRSFEWVALHNKYFVFYLSASELNFSGCQLGTYSEAAPVNKPGESGSGEVGKKWLYGNAQLPAFKIEGQKNLELTFEGYAGPKEYKRLKTINDGLVSIMRLDLFLFFRVGWMQVISTAILKSLTWIQGFIGEEWGYGIAIIIITIVIKTLFWPLTYKSTTSMRKMQKLQPLIKEMREKYKDDAQKMNRKLMELYREHKVNPLGGCLPILFQIPVFFALFNTLRGAIELRQASFLWATDLSLPDTLPWLIMGLPIRPLAILMGLSMFLQQKLAPSTGDPSQKRMMMFMTVFFMFIFYSMPSGLTLYWTTNQILTILQNSIIKRFETDTTGVTK